MFNFVQDALAKKSTHRVTLADAYENLKIGIAC
jgi:hypothetical protein